MVGLLKTIRRISLDSILHIFACVSGGEEVGLEKVINVLMSTEATLVGDASTFPSRVGHTL